MQMSATLWSIPRNWKQFASLGMAVASRAWLINPFSAFSSCIGKLDRYWDSFLSTSSCTRVSVFTWHLNFRLPLAVYFLSLRVSIFFGGLCSPFQDQLAYEMLSQTAEFLMMFISGPASHSLKSFLNYAYRFVTMNLNRWRRRGRSFCVCWWWWIAISFLHPTKTLLSWCAMWTFISSWLRRIRHNLSPPFLLNIPK